MLYDANQLFIKIYYELPLLLVNLAEGGGKKRTLVQKLILACL